MRKFHLLMEITGEGFGSSIDILRRQENEAVSKQHTIINHHMCFQEILASCFEVNTCGIICFDTLVGPFPGEAYERKLNGINSHLCYWILS